MTESREIELNAGSQHLRQFPLDSARVARICKMSQTQADAIRDMNTEELQTQIYVTLPSLPTSLDVLSNQFAT